PDPVRSSPRIARQGSFGRARGANRNVAENLATAREGILMATLSAEDARKLARSFYDLAVKIGKFRFDNWTSMQDAERTQLEKLEWALLTQSSELATRA